MVNNSASSGWDPEPIGMMLIPDCLAVIEATKRGDEEENRIKLEIYYERTGNYMNALYSPLFHSIME